MKNRVRKLLLALLGMKYLLFVPLLVVWVIVPAVAIMYAQVYEEGEGARQTAQLLVTYVPVFAVWWNTFVLKDYLDGESRELYYVYDLRYCSRLPETVCLIALYGICCLPMTFALDMNSDVIRGAFWYAVAAAVVYGAAGYALAFLFRSAYFSVLAAVVYYLLCAVSSAEGSAWNLCSLPDLAGYEGPLPWLAGTALFLLAVGYGVERRACRLRL